MELRPNDIVIRDAEEADAADLAAIWNNSVEKGVSNYETELQNAEDRAIWIKNLKLKQFPVLVALNKTEIVGFAALTPFHSHSGYRFTVSGVLYVKEEHRRTGVGKTLASQLFQEAKQREFHSVLAGVSSENRACIELLKLFGFEEAGVFKEIGFKNGKWHDDVCLQLRLI
jgi:L-amino acid N-acyltransferase